MSFNKIHGTVVPKNNLHPTEMLAGDLMLNAPNDIPWLVKDLIPHNTISGVVGASETGKSAFLRQLATAICNGDETFIGKELNAKHKSCIYVSTEDGQEVFGMLLKKQNLIHNPKINLRLKFDTTDLQKTLLESVRSNPVDCIIIDAYMDVFIGDPNNSMSVRNFFKFYKSLAADFNCSIIFLHHLGKSKENAAPSKNSVLGSQGFESAMRSVIEIRLSQNNPNERNIIILKSNYVSIQKKSISLVCNFSEELVFSSTDKTVSISKLYAKKSIISEEMRTFILESYSKRIPYRTIAELTTKRFSLSISKTTVENVIRVSKQESVQDVQSTDENESGQDMQLGETG